MARACQLALPFPNRWGGARRGAGRKAGARACTPHRARPPHRRGEPVHVTLRARLAPLRSQFLFPVVRLALARASRRAPERFRIVHFSVQRDHLHLIVEAEDERALSSGMRSVAIRVARYVNDVLSRRGPLWAERWHGRALRSPREVRHALVYVLANFRKHATRALPAGVDPFSSALWFDGWRGFRPGSRAGPPPAVGRPWRSTSANRATSEVGATSESRARSARDFAPRTWLAAVGWRRHGLIGLTEQPAADSAQSVAQRQRRTQSG
jgi:REP element-mobilizing transposase RayT